MTRSTPRRAAALAALVALAAARARAQTLLVPMDDAQRNHLKAYGLVYNALKDGQRAEWLLNYRGGAFFIPDLPELRRRAALAGVSVEPEDAAAVADVRRELAGGNMDAVPLERAPRVAIYTPPGAQPWDDAVTLALTYAGIPFEKVWDDDVLAGALPKYEWVHLFHEDFTGQQNKLALAYSGAPWFQEQRRVLLDAAARHGRCGHAVLTAHQIGRSRYARGLMEGRQRARRIGALFGVCGGTAWLRGHAGAASSAQTVLPGRSGVRCTPQSRQRRCTMNMPCPPGRPARCGVRGAGCPAPRSTTSTRSALGVQPIRSSSGPSACRQALVTSSETTSRTSSAAARRSALDAGSHPQSCRACRAKSRAIGTIPLACPRESVRHGRSAGTGEAAPASSGSRPRSPGGCSTGRKGAAPTVRRFPRESPGAEDAGLHRTGSAAFGPRRAFAGKRPRRQQERPALVPG